MKKLNLAYPEKSDVKFTISKFPDGQQSLDIETGKAWIEGADITIEARISTFRDLELIICANQDLLEMKAKSVSLYVPFLLGSRSDRKFKEGGINSDSNITNVLNQQRTNQCYYSSCNPEESTIEKPCFPRSCNLYYTYNTNLC
jgi:phosphoribosylpyrophosphate synthetase